MKLLLVFTLIGLYGCGLMKAKQQRVIYKTKVVEKVVEPTFVPKNVVVDDKIITARGVGATIEMGLKLVEMFTSKEESEKLRKEIVYKI